MIVAFGKGWWRQQLCRCCVVCFLMLAGHKTKLVLQLFLSVLFSEIAIDIFILVKSSYIEWEVLNSRLNLAGSAAIRTINPWVSKPQVNLFWTWENTGGGYFWAPWKSKAQKPLNDVLESMLGSWKSTAEGWEVRLQAAKGLTHFWWSGQWGACETVPPEINYKLNHATASLCPCVTPQGSGEHADDDGHGASWGVSLLPW